MLLKVGAAICARIAQSPFIFQGLVVVSPIMQQRPSEFDMAMACWCLPLKEWEREGGHESVKLLKNNVQKLLKMVGDRRADWEKEHVLLRDFTIWVYDKVCSCGEGGLVRPAADSVAPWCPSFCVRARWRRWMRPSPGRTARP